MFTLSQKLTQTCSALNARNVKYKKASYLKYDQYYGEYYETTAEREEAAIAAAQAQAQAQEQAQYSQQSGEQYAAAAAC